MKKKLLNSLLKDKRGFFDTDVLTSPLFLILAGGSVLTILLGWKISSKAIGVAFPWWQLIIICIVAVGASYFFAARED